MCLSLGTFFASCSLGSCGKGVECVGTKKNLKNGGIVFTRGYDSDSKSTAQI